MIHTCNLCNRNHCRNHNCQNRGSEDFLLHGPPDFVVRVFLATFATRQFNDQMCDNGDGNEQQLARAANCDDELGMDETRHYRLKVSKWIKGSLMCLQDPLFWFMMFAANMAREPVRHMFGILSSYSAQISARVRAPNASTGECAELPIVNFVTRRLDEINREFAALRAKVPDWTHATLQVLRTMICWNEETALQSHAMEAIAVKLVLLNHASFKRRVYSLFSKKLA
ncbi:unnamed protein product [Symbiodinium natans]|uniref:Uncharacterized protein n=1 Tax=Symbiodinium natans TaxID=878477 RepID=A0A812S9R8_9DINO|nr:unnamed protein product [Symbiodinium natans]